MTESCEFCSEFQDVRSSRFGQLYVPHLSSRVVSWSADLALMPTLGQLFKGSMLVVPYSHFETISRMPIGLQQEILGAVASLELGLNGIGKVIVFEHGATSSTRLGCGIYHAHLHVVPVPDRITYRSVLADNVA